MAYAEAVTQDVCLVTEPDAGEDIAADEGPHSTRSAHHEALGHPVAVVFKKAGR